MTRYRKHSMASAIALAMGLTACGGGGGQVASMPPPPPAPPPPPPGPPPPPPTPANTVAPAAAANVPNASLLPQATAGGPTIQAHPETTFPLAQSVVKISSAGGVANTGVMSQGTTFKFASDASDTDIEDLDFRFDVPGLGLSNLLLNAAGGFYCYGAPCGSVGDKSVYLHIPEASYDNLDWTTYGIWDEFDAATEMNRGAFVTGYATPVGSVPTTGSATYTGSVTGRAIFPQVGQQFGVGVRWLTGDASLQANFASATITGSLTNMKADTIPWNSVSLSGTITGGQNRFSGTTAATSAPPTIGSLSGSASGTFGGMFFGPAAQELGAVWTLSDGTATAIGSFGAKTGP